MPNKLLVADDSVTIQRVIELTFADEDIQVIAVGDGHQAIHRIESDRPDIVLADVSMPERDGYEVATFVKNSPHLAHIPVLLLTGAFEPVDEAKARSAGCDGVLAKPFEPQTVINRVRELLRARPAPAVAFQAHEAEAAEALVVEHHPYMAIPVPVEAESVPAWAAGESPIRNTGAGRPAVWGARETIILGPGAEASSGAEPVDVPAAAEVRDIPEPFVPTFGEPKPVERQPMAFSEPEPLAPRPAARHFAEPGPASPRGLSGEKSAESLDDYFDRLDAEFGSVDGEGAGAALPHGGPESVRDVLEAPSAADMQSGEMERALDAVDWAEPGAFAPRAPEPSRDEPMRPADSGRWTPAGAESHPVASPRDAAAGASAGGASGSRGRPEPWSDRHSAPAGGFTGASATPDVRHAGLAASGAAASASPRPQASSAARGIEPAPLADAFAALLAAEQGGALPEPPALPDEFVDQVTQRVLERLAERLTRDTVTDVVLSVAERLVRQEIDRLKSSAR